MHKRFVKPKTITIKTEAGLIQDLVGTPYSQLTSTNIQLLKKSMIARQANTCPVCHQPFSEVRVPMLDHDHELDKTREVLCRQCNFGLGFFEDCVLRLDNAIAYLLTHMKVHL